MDKAFFGLYFKEVRIIIITILADIRIRFQTS